MATKARFSLSIATIGELAIHEILTHPARRKEANITIILTLKHDKAERRLLGAIRECFQDIATVKSSDFIGQSPWQGREYMLIGWHENTPIRNPMQFLRRKVAPVVIDVISRAKDAISARQRQQREEANSNANRQGLESDEVPPW